MRLDAIQALRALAAYLVLFFHLHGNEVIRAGLHGQEHDSLLGGALANGFAGVDLFFVISGFIMVYVTMDRPSGLATMRDFILARAFRIYPAWWLFLGFLMLFLFVETGIGWDAAALKDTSQSGPEHLLKSVFLFPQESLPVLNVGWTLVHELYFYLVFAGLLLLPRRFLPACLLIWATIIVSVSLTGRFTERAPAIPFLVFNPMTLEFIAGALAGWVFTKGYQKHGLLCLILGAVGLFVILQFFPVSDKFRNFWERPVLYTLPSVLMVYGAASLPQDFTKNLISSMLSRLGNWSFSLYLSHPLTLLAIIILNGFAAGVLETRFGFSADQMSILRLGSAGMADNVLFIVEGLLLSTFVAGISFHLFEQPVLKFLNRFRHRQSDKEKARLAETIAP